MADKNHCPDADALRHYVLGQISDVQAQPLENHLSGCEGCVEALQTIEGDDVLTLLMRSQQPPPHDAATDDLMQRLKALGQSKQTTTSVFGQGTNTSTDPQLPKTPVPEELAHFLAPAQAEDEVGRLGPYRVLRMLGWGGMGIVFEAEDTVLGRRVALKTMKPALAAMGPARQRFLYEARAAAAFTHDYSVPIYQVGEEHGIPFLAMQLLKGETLDERLEREKKLPLHEVVRIGIETAEGLAAAHAQGLVHRDIKPTNLWLETQEPTATGCPFRVKILDFGLAQAAQADTRLTEPGTIVGTPAYMAPEQARGEAVDGRSDLFSLGTVLYTLCTGLTPFQRDSKLATLRAVCDDTPRPIQRINPEVPGWLAAVIGRLLAKRPEDRFAGAGEVAQVLRQQLQKGGPFPSSQRSRDRRLAKRAGILAAGVLLLIAGGLAWSEVTGVTHFFAKTPPVRAAANEAPPDRSDVVAENGTAQEATANAATEGSQPKAYPMALFVFEERGSGAKELGSKVTDLLYAELTAKPELILVDRQELKKTLEEQELNLSGAVKAAEATKVGQLTGAKLLLTGSVLHIDKKIHLVAKVIGTETSRVAATKVDGASSDDLGPLVAKLANQLVQTIEQQSDKLVAKAVSSKDRLAALQAKLPKGPRPVLWISIAERHVSQTTFDPAAQTEMTYLGKGTGFTVVDAEEGSKAKADILITGEGISESATRHGNLVSVKARVEVKAVDRRTGNLLAIDRHVAVAVDLTEQIAGKAALQEAAAAIAERLLPQLLQKP
jgi:serine/threonine protein kinase/TolB-like protein